MPIVGMTDNISEAWPTLGKLHKGSKKKENGQMGDDLTHFRFTSDRPDVLEAFEAVYNGKPTIINVFLPYPNAEAPNQDGEGCFMAYREKWNASNTLLHRCDGKFVTRYYNDQGQYIDPTPGTMKCPGGCTQTGRLFVIIPELWAAGHVGQVTLETHSIHDIRSILGSLLKTAKMRRGNPDGLMGVRHTLQRVDEMVSSPSWKDEPKSKRHRVQKSLVKLVPEATWVQMQLEAQHKETLSLVAQTPETPEEVLARGNALLHGNDDPDIDTETGEIIEGGAPAETGPEWPDDQVEAGEDAGNDSEMTPAQQAAFYFTMPSGTMLGKHDLSELLDIKAWCEERPNQEPARATLLHVNEMIGHLENTLGA